MKEERESVCVREREKDIKNMKKEKGDEIKDEI